MRTPFRLLLFLPPLLCACDPAEDVRVQELPALQRSSLEARLGLPELRGPWRFAGWELPRGDSVGLDADLPTFGILWLQTQKRDSLAGFYLTAGGGRAPLQGEVRRDSVVALVAFPAPGDGRYLVGEVSGDTLWLEGTTLADPGSWRGDARAAFVRSQAAIAPFRRIRGVYAAAPPPDSALLAAGADSLRPGAGAIPPLPGAGTAATAGATAGARPPAATPRQPTAPPPVRPATPTPRAETPAAVPLPVTEPVPTEAPVEEEDEPEPEPEPAVEREPPRVLGVPVVRDTAGGQLP